MAVDSAEASLIVRMRFLLAAAAGGAWSKLLTVLGEAAGLLAESRSSFLEWAYTH